MKVLVTGASGFVGRIVIPELSRVGIEVHATSRHGTKPEKAATFVATDLDDSQLGALLEGTDAVVHLAARAHAIGEHDNDLTSLYSEANAKLTERLAIAAIKSEVSHFVFCSSVKAVGEITRTDAFTEATPPCPYDAYGKSKLEAERALEYLSEASGMAVTVLRPPLMYGPGVKGNLYRVMHALHKGMPLPLSGISNRRSMLGARNFGSAIATVLATPGQGYSVYFLSDGAPISTPELLRSIAIAMHKPARLFSVPHGLLRFAAVALRKAAEFERLTGSLVIDDRAFRQKFGWVPPYSQEAGLREMVDSFLARDDQRRPR